MTRSVGALRNVVVWSSLALGLGAATVATAEQGARRRPVVSGDFRFRLEQDWDSRRADGSARADRLRARVRARVGVTFEATDTLRLGLRLRTGSRASHQSPHITVHDFEGNDTGDADFSFDRWFVETRSEHGWAWAGRNSFPFWKQNEMFWDDDVTVLGLAAGWSFGALSVRTAYVGLPVGMEHWSGDLAAVQVVYEPPGSALTLAGGVYSIEADPTDPDAFRSRNGNGTRDYSIAVASAQTSFELGGRRLVMGLDLLSNTESYGPDDPFAHRHRDDTEGVVFSARWGAASDRGQWQLGYTYARIETLAVNASYAQDDWVRWGSATQTDSSDFRGHEFRSVYGLGRAGNLTARLYLVEAISSIQDGKRLRIDYNVSL